MSDEPSRRLNLGAGTQQPEGWVNVDSDPQWARYAADGNPMVLADPLLGLPWSAGPFDGVVAHHVLQMVAWPDLVPWLSEVRRVMRPGAVLRLSVPDLLGAVDAYERMAIGWFPIADGHEPTIDGKLCMYLSQAGATRSVFTANWLEELLTRAGFDDGRARANRWGDEWPPWGTNGERWLMDLDSRQGESLYAEATAP